MSYVTDEGNEAPLHVKMATSGQAAALYRAVTEKHAFYCCETVRSDVTEQFIRDLKVNTYFYQIFSVLNKAIIFHSIVTSRLRNSYGLGRLNPPF